MIIVGCDPGLASGALAMLNGDSFVKASIIKTIKPSGTKEKQIDPSWMMDWLGNKVDLAVIEYVHALPKQGVTSMFNFGKAYGAELALLRLVATDVVVVSPLVWKTVLLSRNGYTRDKGNSVKFIEDCFPGCVNLLRPPRSRASNHNIAEAMCLAAYGKQLRS